MKHHEGTIEKFAKAVNEKYGNNNNSAFNDAKKNNQTETQEQLTLLESQAKYNV